ncbi:MAG: hypothetical protein QOF48_3312 [Verrucomicrobiota bacterium]|jgi:hypothetical protein
MRTAFKEWATVVDALGHGEQILVLRKGGIAEGRDGFQIEHRRFFLFPTLFHQQRESVTEPAQRRFDQISHTFPGPDIARIEFLAEVAASRRLESLSETDSLHGQHIWRPEVISDRFDWGKEKNIFALAVRVYRLPLVIELPMSPQYAGCKSWVELDKDIPTMGMSPVLDQAAFDHKLQQFFSALNPAVP